MVALSVCAGPPPGSCAEGLGSVVSSIRDGASLHGIRGLYGQDSRELLPPFGRERTQRAAICESGNNSCRLPDLPVLGSETSRAASSDLLLFVSHPVCSVLLQQSEC